ncbi:DUF4365 domain-containing protein [Frigoriglobus tundricola]|uniref:DUF4365 domain-containing protein n=1 Tax=Frigoriglobus tundricola TaxID=2774151 RepID=A0A6M5YV02_9BACT|nr:DUF4365 domain-containing protein [Frigoriglobus tundricola]QJW97083.1 hypothetical protein FTUN_4648 [Frigoriglobus tundricola]
MMTRQDRQEVLSLAYVHAVAAMCGMTHSARAKDHGIDLTLHEIVRDRGRFTESGMALELQLKSTTSVAETKTDIGYDLSIRAYDILRAEIGQVRLLVVFVLPASENEWLRQTRAKLELRKCAYWVSLRGRSAVKNRSSVRIPIPKRQIFTPDAIRAIIERKKRGEELT